MVGCPGSGKSTWAKKHLPDTYYVSRDEVRFSLLQDGEDYFSHEKEVFNKTKQPKCSFLWANGIII